MLDEKDWAILEALQEDARLPFAELARRTGLSPPSATERVKRLEDQGIITGYRAVINPTKLSRPLAVFVRITVSNKEYSRFQRFVENAVELTECHHVSGTEAFLLRASVESVAALESLLQRLSAYGQTTTSLVLSTCLERRVFRRPRPGAARKDR